MEKYKGNLKNSKSINAYKDLLISLSINNHLLKSNYINSSTKVLIDFNCIHGESLISPNHYKRNKGCPKCSIDNLGKSKNKKFKTMFTELILKNNHEILNNTLINSSEKVLIDFKCNHKPSFVNPFDYIKGHRCSKCGREKYSSEKKENYSKNFYNIVNNNNHKVLSKYNGVKDKILIDFKCGHKPNYILVGDYINGHRCSECGIKCRSNNKIELNKIKFKQMVNDNNHKLLSEYEKGNKKVLIDFKCGHQPHKIQPQAYIQGNRCPLCNQSKGELKIRKWLEEKGVFFNQEYKFKNCKNKISLRFDFFIPILNICIEYDGIFHYKPIEKLGGVKGYEYTKKNDTIKNEFCKKNNIKLTRIPYWEFDNIEEILNKSIMNE